MAMGRTSTRNQNLPIGMRARHRSDKTYYYLDLGGKPRKEISLGNDYILAVKKWTELKQSSPPKGAKPTFKSVWDKYEQWMNESDLSAATKKDYVKCSKNLLKFFNDPPAPLDSIEPIHIRQYLDWRGKESTDRANKERAFFSLLWNKARSWGYTSKENPCAGVQGFTPSKRTVYVEDNIYNLVYEQCDQPTKDALDLSYLTAQRPADVIKMDETAIQDGVLLVKQNKTDAKLRISIIGELERLINRIQERKKQFKVFSLKLIVDEHGKPLSQRAIWQRFDNARKKASVNNPKLTERINEYQWRDLRAKGGTDKASQDDIRTAQKLLGHTSVNMTERYVRARIGESVKPTK